MGEKPKIFVLYNNGHMETVDRIGIIYLHLIEIGVIKFVYNPETEKAHVRSEDGSTKEVTVTNVGGLL